MGKRDLALNLIWGFQLHDSLEPLIIFFFDLLLILSFGFILFTDLDRIALLCGPLNDLSAAATSEVVLTILFGFA